LDLEATLSTVAQLCVPRLADWCSIHLTNEDGSLAEFEVAHVDPAKAAVSREMRLRWPINPKSSRGTAQVLRTGAPELVPDVDDEYYRASAQDAEHLAAQRALGI